MMKPTSDSNGKPNLLDASPDFQLYRPDNPQFALGLAVSHLMTKPAFANLQFGEWSRVLVGQVNRRHFAFAVNTERKVVGFAGWALTTREKAEGWVEGKHALNFQDSLAGECIVFNCWTADSLKVHRFMVDEARLMFADKETMYFKRYYETGRLKPVRLNVNEFVERHIERKSNTAALNLHN